MYEIFYLIIFIWALGFLFTFGWITVDIKNAPNSLIIIFSIIFSFIAWPIFIGHQCRQAINMLISN